MIEMSHCQLYTVLTWHRDHGYATEYVNIVGIGAVRAVYSHIVLNSLVPAILGRDKSVSTVLYVQSYKDRVSGKVK